MLANYLSRRHIYFDLQPYVCLDVSCPHSGTTFETREKWISHLALDHEMEPKWDSIECPFCKHVTGSGKLAVTKHLAEHLEEISLSALPIQVYSNEVSEDGSRLGDTDDDSEDHQENSRPNAKGKGKLTAIADNDPINETRNNPCSTLFVYNLPSEVSEEELKAVFSKQKGYKGVFFKATQNFPLSFVKFDSTSSAMKAVLDLHGKPQSLLKNGRGGVLLSFASNFLSQFGELRSGEDRLDAWPEVSASESTPYPPGWDVLMQEKTHRIYYYNSQTNVTRWKQPLFNPAYDPPSNQPPIHQGWTPLFDHGHQQWLYASRETGRMQWEAPFFNPMYHPSPNRPPIPPGWITLYDHRYQRWYYVNQETKWSQWEAPDITQVALKEAAEKPALEAKEQVVLPEEGQMIFISKEEAKSMAAPVAKKETGDELLREDQQTLHVSAAKTERELSAQEEERAAREETRVLREEARVLREELQALKEGIRAAQTEQTARDEDRTAQKAKEQTTGEVEKRAKDLSPSDKSPRSQAFRNISLSVPHGFLENPIAGPAVERRALHPRLRSVPQNHPSDSGIDNSTTSTSENATAADPTKEPSFAPDEDTTE